MNKTAIRKFAEWAREKLIEDIKYKAGIVGITENGIAEKLPQSTRDTYFYDVGTKDYTKISGVEIKQRDALVKAIQTRERSYKNYQEALENVIEEVAYTWFNRLIAIRFMEVNDYLPSGVRVLSSENKAKKEPDLVTTPFDTDLEFTSYEQDRIIQLKDDNKLDELFRMLFIKQCNRLHDILPELFEKTDDYSELLLTISFTDPEGIIHHLINDIEDVDFRINDEMYTDDRKIKADGQVEIIGWLYQYYISKKHDKIVNIYKGTVKKADIPAATQLFTTDWVVRYMVDNSLGRYWIERNPQSKLAEKLEFFVTPKNGEIQYVDEKINPTDLTFFDPCMGSGHILVYKTIEYSSSYDVLVDGKVCSSTEQREAILKEYKINSKCVQFDSMKTMKQADLRSIFTGQDVVYIYHNQIDARGDKAASENEVFTACEEAIEEIYTLIKRIASQANTYHFIVTADHGFIYKRDKIQPTDKIAGAASKSNSVGQRYSISAEEIKADGVCHTTVGKVLGSADERIVSFPLASDIFKVAGAGQNYVHGGCSPQEMLVPMIDVKVDKGKKETSLAEIALVSLTSKITNLITTLDFVQTEPVSDVVKETSYRVYFISDNNEKISNENIVIADKKDKDTTKRMFRLRFNFKNKKYDKSQKYYLVAYDDKNDIEVLRHEIIMDIAFADDFGFFG